ncbi:hypothetical protein [Streptomyces sp. NPDC096152]
MLRITAPFFVLVERPSAVPCDLVYARAPDVCKSAHTVKWTIVTTS